jgi:ADP-ribosylglycohydrolase
MLESVIYILCIAVNYHYSIRGAVSLGGANGMRGSLVGLSAGIYYGYKSIPKEWLNDLRNKAYLEKWIRKIRRS